MASLGHFFILILIFFWGGGLCTDFCFKAKPFLFKNHVPVWPPRVVVVPPDNAVKEWVHVKSVQRKNILALQMVTRIVFAENHSATVHEVCCFGKIAHIVLCRVRSLKN